MQADLIASASQRDDYLWWVVLRTTECKLCEVLEFRQATDEKAHEKAIEERQRFFDADRVDLANLLRDIFGNPFRPVAFSPEWRTSTAVAVAQEMYESRDFGAMPILAVGRKGHCVMVAKNELPDVGLDRPVHSRPIMLIEFFGVPTPRRR